MLAKYNSGLMPGKKIAVRLSNDPDFRAVSDPAANYTKLVEEFDYFSDMDYDWKYLLNHLIGLKNGSIKFFDLNGKQEPNYPTLESMDMQSAPVKADEKRVKRERPKPLLKCHYCMLSYNSEKERREHEALWHAEKIEKGSD